MKADGERYTLARFAWEFTPSKGGKLPSYQISYRDMKTLELEDGSVTELPKCLDYRFEVDPSGNFVKANHP